MKKPLVFGVCLLLGLLGMALPTAADDFAPPPDMNELLEFRAMKGLLLAQVSDEDPPIRGEGHHRRMMERMQQKKHLEQLRMLKILELLELSEDQEVPFLIAFNGMRKKQRELDGRINQLVDTLAREIHEGSADEARINSLIDRALELEKVKHQKMMEFIDRARTMLTAEQVGKLVIFRKRFESELLERIGRFRQGMGKGMGRGPDGG